MDKKGNIADLLIFPVIALAFLILFIFFYFLFGQIYSAVAAIPETTEGGYNITQIGDATAGQLDSGKAPMKWGVFLIISALAISILISNYFISINIELAPIIFVVYIFIIIFAIIGAVYISNAYEEQILTNSALGDTAKEFSAASFVMLQLPIWVTIVGFIGLILMLINVRTSSGGFGI